MKEYIMTVFFVSLAASLVILLAPGKEGVGKYVRIASALVITSALTLPISGLLDSLSRLDISSHLPEMSEENEKYNEYFKESYKKAELDNLKRGIKAMLKESFGISESNVKVDALLSEQEGRLDKLYITLYGSAVFKDTGAIEDYLASLFGCEVITIIG